MSQSAVAREPLAALLDSYDELTKSLLIPRTDLHLYDALFVKPLRDYRAAGLASGRTPPVPIVLLHRDETYGPLLGALQRTLQALRQHERDTVYVLQLIDAREDVLARLIACENFYKTGKSSLDDAQVNFMVIMEELQARTVQVVEAIEAWRAHLCRPFAFRLGNGQDYLQRIREDCEAIAASSLGQQLNLRVDQFPCCSNVDLPRLVRRKQLMRRAKLVSTGAMWQQGLEPARPETAATTKTTANALTRPAWENAAMTETSRSGSVALWARERRGQAGSPRSAPSDPTAAPSAHTDANHKPRQMKQKRLLKAEALILGAELAQEQLMESLWQLAHLPTIRDPNDTGRVVAAAVAEGATLSFFAPLLYLPSVLRYEEAAGSSLPVVPPAKATTMKSKATGRAAAGGAAGRKRTKAATEPFPRESVCVPLAASMWTAEALLQRAACLSAAVPLTNSGDETGIDVRGLVAPPSSSATPAAATKGQSTRHHDRLPRGAYSSASSSLSSSRTSSTSTPLSSRSSSSLRSSHASSRSQHDEAYQPYKSSSESSGTSRSSSRSHEGHVSPAAVPVQGRTPSASSSHTSSQESIPFAAKDGANYDGHRSNSHNSSSSSDDDDDHEASYSGGIRRPTQDESLEMLRQQLLEERRLSMSRSQSQSQVASPARAEVAPGSTGYGGGGGVVLPVPSPPANPSALSSPVHIAPAAARAGSDASEDANQTDGESD